VELLADQLINGLNRLVGAFDRIFNIRVFLNTLGIDNVTLPHIAYDIDGMQSLMSVTIIVLVGHLAGS